METSCSLTALKVSVFLTQHEFFQVSHIPRTAANLQNLAAAQMHMMSTLSYIQTIEEPGEISCVLRLGGFW
jgi:hypothetical protein